jgi:hypothetical protein
MGPFAFWWLVADNLPKELSQADARDRNATKARCRFKRCQAIDSLLASKLQLFNMHVISGWKGTLEGSCWRSVKFAAASACGGRTAEIARASYLMISPSDVGLAFARERFECE